MKCFLAQNLEEFTIYQFDGYDCFSPKHDCQTFFLAKFPALQLLASILDSMDLFRLLGGGARFDKKRFKDDIKIIDVSKSHGLSQLNTHC